MINNVDEDININKNVKKSDEKYKYNRLIKICKFFFCKCNKKYLTENNNVNNNENRNSELDIQLKYNI